jgi:hypothetical protein
VEHDFVRLQLRSPKIARLFFRVPDLLDKPVSRTVLHQIYEDANPRVISKVIKRSLVDPGRQGKGTELMPQEETEIISRIEGKSARN